VATITTPTHGRAEPEPARRPTCLCGKQGVRDDKHDAYYCPESGTWLEDGCDDPTCFMCKGRPPHKEV
jgi:hypothetical protein